MKYIILAALFALVSCGPRGGLGGISSHGGASGHGGFHPLPPFLNGLNSTTVASYFNCFKDNTSTIAAQNQCVLTWADQYGLTTVVQEAQTNMTNFKNALQQNVTTIIGQLSSVLPQLQQIFDNQNQTRAQQHQAIEALRNTTGAAVDVLLFIPKILLGHGGPGPHGGPGGAHSSFGGNKGLKGGKGGHH